MLAGQVDEELSACQVRYLLSVAACVSGCVCLWLLCLWLCSLWLLCLWLCRLKLNAPRASHPARLSPWPARLPAPVQLPLLADTCINELKPFCRQVGGPVGCMGGHSGRRAYGECSIT